MNDTRLWESQEKEEIEKLYREAGSVEWLQNSIEHLLSKIKELEEEIAECQSKLLEY